MDRSCTLPVRTLPNRALLGLALVSVTSLLMADGVARADDWTRFRGPNGSGVSEDQAPVPAEFSATQNLKWKVELPGPGSSSPIVVGNKVFVTCWSGYGTDRNSPGDQDQLRRHLVCVDRETGKIVWDKSVAPELPEDRFGGMFAEHGYASHTPICDGQRVYVFFGKSGALAFDLDGNQLWQTKVGEGLDPSGWGSASSPVLYKNILIVTASAESNSLVGLDTATGKELWRQQADGIAGTWGTPVLVPVDDTRTDLVIGVPGEIWGINPETGKLRWYSNGVSPMSFCSSVVADNGIVYAIEGREGGSIAVRAGGKGDVSESYVVWSGRDRGRIATPLIADGRLYFIASKVVKCLDAKTGETVFEGRLTGGQAAAGGEGGRPGGQPGGQPGGFGGRGRGGMGGQDYSSPVAADGKLFYVARNGDIFVVKLGTEFEQLAVNRLTADREDFSGSPAISNGQLFIRSSRHLYCVAK